ncbi:hypothetical protein [Williamsia herbipolensis]|uniref:Secreted protein n=1 Tax=Williamsia herbipolensis TaxID=1603258 RepID=A0AAU4JZI2_9NOCA|nr:hypothetical protein [Williamsia herbipolensis]MCX6468374.1 hypothetical protein [Mycobacteriales bacterium]
MTGDAASLRSRLIRGPSESVDSRPDGSGPAATRPGGLLRTRRGGRRTERRGSLTSRGARAERRELMALARDQARSPLATIRQLAGTSPGKLFLIAVILVIGAIATGWYASTSLDNRTAALAQTISDTEPIAESSQVLYSDLSIADASANAAFISGGLEPAALRSRYSAAIATASQALIQAASGTAEENTTVRDDLNSLAEQLPVYTGLVESARTNNRLGNPVGSAYLGEASNLMQTTILPAAQRLYAARSTAISDPQNRFTDPPWGVYAALAVLLVALIATHQYLARRTRRRLNLGLLLAIGFTVVAALWVLVGSLLSVSATNSAETRGAQPLRDLTSARILTQQARSAETLSLVRRGDEATLQNQFVSANGRIAATLNSYLADTDDDDDTDARESVQRALAALSTWQTAHAATIERSNAGDFNGATAMAVGNTANGAAQAYMTLDRALIDGITRTRTAFRDDINTARVVIGYVGSGALVLGLLAAATSALGMTPRIREYR